MYVLDGLDEESGLGLLVVEESSIPQMGSKAEDQATEPEVGFWSAVANTVPAILLVVGVVSSIAKTEPPW